MQDPTEVTAGPAAPTAPVTQVTSPTVSVVTGVQATPPAPPDALAQSEWTRRLLVVASVIVVGLSILGIVGVMCYRVIIDGNSSLTNDITTKLMWVAIVGIGSMIAGLFGNNSLAGKVIDKLIAS